MSEVPLYGLVNLEPFGIRCKSGASLQSGVSFKSGDWLKSQRRTLRPPPVQGYLAYRKLQETAIL